MRSGFIMRFLALLLALCTVLSLLPSVALLRAEAADTVATETASLISELKTSYNSFTIPVNKEVFNYTSLDGVFFIRESGSGRTIDFSKGRSEHTDRLTANTSEGSPASKYYHLSSVSVTAANEGSLTKINGSTPNNLNYAVEIKKYTDKITRDTTTVTTVNDVKYTGWAGYIKYEYNRDGSWSGDKLFGTYLGINGIPTTSDPVYSIKSLHSSRASAPYVATVNKNGSMNYTSTAFPWFLKVNSTNASVKIYKLDPTGATRYTYWLGFDKENSNYLSGHTISQIVREDRNKSTAAKFENCNKQGFEFRYWDFFQVSPVSLELYRALEKAEAYVTNGNAEGKYPAETYLGFLKYLKSAMATYNAKRTVWSTDKNHADRISLDTIATDLQSYMALLEIEAKPDSYMDIPMEVLDFRADGLMFEFLNGANAYSLSSAAPSIGSHAFPGTVVTAENGIAFAEGLIEPTLIDGHIVYTEKTVSYIATAMYIQHMTFSDPAATTSGYIGDFGAEDFDPYYNSVFMALIDPNTGNRGSSSTAERPSNSTFCTVGSWNDTLAKTEENGGPAAGENGGILRYDQVTTFYDLAYYILNNIWRQTPSDDVIQTVTKDGKTFDLPYNVKIDELTTMRLLKDSSGNYIFSSDKANGRNLDTGLIFNYDLTTSSGDKRPTLNAGVDLGFEHPDMLGNNSTGAVEDPSVNHYGKRNYSMMYHVRSSFIYYEEKNLNFSFIGDDDVYFFINGELVCEIGGTHSAADSAVSLNGKVAQELGLEDGDICTFDMYLAERHTNGINLNLKTNIEMMPVGAVTDKVQYEYTQAGEIGKDIREGAVVADETEVGYGFKLLNRSEHGATDLTFTDEALGVSLSGTGLDLGGCANTEDLILIYRTYDPQTNTLNESEPQSRTYESFCGELREAVDDLTSVLPMAEGSYILTGLTEEQIMALLEIGLPANVQISVYGFHRTVSASVGGYTNTVKTTCRPISSRNQDGSYNYGVTIQGSATRNLNVQTMNTVTAEPLDIVIDYGKPVTFTEEEILRTVTYDPQDVELSLAGIDDSGRHGDIVFKEPAELPLVSAGDSLDGKYGVFDVGTASFRYTPNGMVEDMERIYARVCVYDTYLGNNWWLTVEIRIIPANMMYYEAEKLSEAGELTFTEKYTEEVTEAPTEEGTTETEPAEGDPGESTEEAPAESQPEDDGVRINTHISHLTDQEQQEHPINTYDPTDDQRVLFFSFDSSTNEAQRYTQNPVYGGVDFSNVSNWWSPGYGSITGISNGAIHFTTTNTDNPWGYIATGKADPNNKTNASKADFPMEFIPSDDDWCEIRLRVNKTDQQNGTGLHLRMEFFPFSHDTSLTKAAVSTKLFPENALNNDWFLLKFPLTTIENTENPCSIKYTELSIVRRINFLIRGLDTGETFTTDIDYIYIGPEETCPSNQRSDYLYLGFDNRAADQYRYTNPIYGSSFNYDSVGGWNYNKNRSPSVKIENGAMVASVGAYGSETTNSPWLQTCFVGSDQNNMFFPVTTAEVARIRIKLQDLTAWLPGGGEEEGSEEQPSVRLGFVLDEDATYEDSSCWVDWYLTEEQLAGCDYVTLSADIRELLAFHEAERIAAIRVTVMYAASMEGKTGYVTIDEIYIGPETPQDSDTYIAPSETVIHGTPEKESYTPNYDNRVIYFGFDNTTADKARYTQNPVYGGKNFDEVANWWGPTYSAYKDFTASIANGALTYSVTTENTWGYCATGGKTGTSNAASAAEFPLSYIPTQEDWCEIRLRLDGITANGENVNLNLELFNTAGTTDSGTYSKFRRTFPASKIGEGYITLSFAMNDTTCDEAQLKYSEQNIVRRINIVLGNLAKGKNYTCSIDYFYMGPEDTMPSRIAGDHVYIGFENDSFSEYKYNSGTYGGTNFDLATNWRAGRYVADSRKIVDGALTYTITKSVLNADGSRSGGEPWFETQRGGVMNGLTMNYDHTKAEVAQIRVKFTGMERVDPDKPVILEFRFADTYRDEPVTYIKQREIPASEVVTDGKWFTYVVDVKELLANTENITGFRVRFLNIHSPDEEGTIAFDYFYLGPSLDKESQAYRRDDVYTYGYDSSYALDSRYSDNETLYTEGRGVPKMNADGSADYEGSRQYTELSFRFTGTGFDLIGRTGAEQATVRVSIFTSEEMTADSRVKSLTVNSKGELELYQIPIVSVEGLEYRTYFVTVWVNDKTVAPQIPGLDLSSLARGNQFCLDGVRIYDPIYVEGETLTETQTIALEAYRADGEAYPYVKEIRDILLTRETFDTLEGELPGAVYIDMETTPTEIVEVTGPDGEPTGETVVQTPEGIVVEDHITAKVETYSKAGPKNEVYLAPQQAVAFRLAVDTTVPVGTLDLGAKIILPGGEGSLAAGFVSGTNTVEGTMTFSLQSGTQQYFALDTDRIRSLTANSEEEVYLVIYNASEEGEKNVISLTDIKAAYTQEPNGEPVEEALWAQSPEAAPLEKRSLKRNGEAEEPVRFLVDGSAVRAAVAFVSALWETPPQEDEPEGDNDSAPPENGPVAEEITIRHSLNLANDISINYLIAGSDLEGYENISMICELPLYQDDRIVDTRRVVLMPEEKGDYVYFTLTGLTAVQMKDEVKATLSMTREGVVYTTPADTYSIAQYAYGQLARESAGEPLKALCAELLRYGTAAQTYKNYRTDSPADGDMTEAQRALLTDLETVAFDSFYSLSDQVEGSTVAWAGKALVLDSKVAIRYILDLSTFTGRVEDLSLVLTYRDMTGEEKTVILENPVVYNEAKGLYSLDFAGLLSAELRQVVRARVYWGETPVTGVMEYSVSTYGNGKSGTLGELCKCLMAYSDSAKAFFMN